MLGAAICCRCGLQATDEMKEDANIPTQSAAVHLEILTWKMHRNDVILAALLQREHTGKGSYVYFNHCQTCKVINLCRIKLKRTQIDAVIPSAHFAILCSAHPNYKWEMLNLLVSGKA